MTSKIGLAVIIIISIFFGFFVYPQAWDKLHISPGLFKFAPPFRLGLDLQGGAHLEYEADLSTQAGIDVADSMNGVRDTIEKRVNFFGVAEPIVQVEGENRLIVELAGVHDVNQAIEIIGMTPFLDFRELSDDTASASFVPTGLTGKHLKSAEVQSDQVGRPEVVLNLTDEGKDLFAEITKRNLGKVVAIFLDGQPISIPVVQSEITNGSAVISGKFSSKEAQDLRISLNAGALPVPINLITQKTVGATLGIESLYKSLKAGLYALIFVAVFMIVFYRLPGLAAVLALAIYTILVLSIYKFFGVTLTLAGIAGFILSLGIAVDANVLIFSRLREELKNGRTLQLAVDEGFRRAWFSIRDSHFTTIIGALVLYMFTTSIIKGFALTLGIGVLISLFSSIIVTRAFVNRIIGPWFAEKKWLF